MRHNTPESVGKGVGAAVETSPGPGEGDFLARVNTTITNFKELGKIFMQLQGGQQQQTDEPEPAKEIEPKALPPPQPRAPGLLDYVQLAIKAGYGNIPIGTLIQQASPHTLSKLMEMIQNAGLKK